MASAAGSPMCRRRAAHSMAAFHSAASE
jgi:hypothetical protein